MPGSGAVPTGIVGYAHSSSDDAFSSAATITAGARSLKNLAAEKRILESDAPFLDLDSARIAYKELLEANNELMRQFRAENNAAAEQQNQLREDFEVALRKSREDSEKQQKMHLVLMAEILETQKQTECLCSMITELKASEDTARLAAADSEAVLRFEVDAAKKEVETAKVALEQASLDSNVLNKRIRELEAFLAKHPSQGVIKALELQMQKIVAQFEEALVRKDEEIESSMESLSSLQQLLAQERMEAVEREVSHQGQIKIKEEGYGMVDQQFQEFIIKSKTEQEELLQLCDEKVTKCTSRIERLQEELRDITMQRNDLSAQVKQMTDDHSQQDAKVNELQIINATQVKEIEQLHAELKRLVSDRTQFEYDQGKQQAADKMKQQKMIAELENREKANLKKTEDLEKAHDDMKREVKKHVLMAEDKFLRLHKDFQECPNPFQQEVRELQDKFAETLKGLEIVQEDNNQLRRQIELERRNFNVEREDLMQKLELASLVLNEVNSLGVIQKLSCVAVETL